MFVFSKGKPKTTNILREPCKTIGMTRSKHRAKSGNKDANNDEGKYTTTKDRIRHNVWFIPIGGLKGIKHAAPFPEKLPEDHILSWSNEEDIILDPMCGSGTTCKMAKLNNRKFIGIDCSEEYCKIAKERIDAV